MPEVTEAWILRRGATPRSGPGALELAKIELPPLGDEDVLVEPLYGCWEGNMTHALERDPVDVAMMRGEPYVVLGNAAVARVLAVGPAVTICREGDICMTIPNGSWDEFGNTITVFGFDARGTLGCLAKRSVWNQWHVSPLRGKTTAAFSQGAGFPVRFATAWDNWHRTFAMWNSQFPKKKPATVEVWGWGGGVALAELMLAKRFGCKATMIVGNPARKELASRLGIEVVERDKYPDLYYDKERFEQDRPYRAKYHQAETQFLKEVRERTGGAGVSIFIDNIGAPVFPATMGALGRSGIITTCGWKYGQLLSFHRAPRCIQRQTFVHSHGCNREDGLKAWEYGSTNDWLPPLEPVALGWEDVPKLAADYRAGKIDSYFPVFAINPQ